MRSLALFLLLGLTSANVIVKDFTLVKSSYKRSRDPSVSSGQMGLLLYNGGTVCADGFGDNEANAICRDMGYGSAAAWSAEFSSWSTKHEDLVDITWDFDMMLSEVRCKDQNWSSCTHTDATRGYPGATCGYPGAVFLTCTTGEGCGNKYDEDQCQSFIDADGGCDRPHTVAQDSCEFTCDLCPVDGGWGEYSKWGKCSEKCGGGIQTQDKTCDNPAPVNGGKDCVGDSQATQACNENACPVDEGCVIENFDFWGADIPGYSSIANVISLDDCISRCGFVEECLSVTHRPSTSTCWLKNKRYGDKPAAKDGVNSRNFDCDGSESD